MADTVHLADPTHLHGIRCNHRGNTKRSFDLFRVTCSQCRGLGKPFEQPPEKAMRVHGFLSVTDLAGPDGRTLNLNNVIFVEGGQLIWFEEPNIFAVARFDGTVDRYEGEWEAEKATADV